MKFILLLFLIIIFFYFFKSKETFNNKNYYISYQNFGEWGMEILKILLPKLIKNKNLIFKQVKYPDLLIENVFSKDENIDGRTSKIITISGESYKSNRSDKAIFNLISLKPNSRKDIWFPYICWKLDREKINKLIYKKFKKINERENFLIYLASKCIHKRDNFFKLINIKQKGCHAGGGCCNNIKLKNDKGRSQFTRNEDLFMNYKFVLCMENKSFPGYITEKILNAYLGGAIPIYWGDTKTVEYFFNPKSFINVNNFKSDEECVDYIIELSKNPKKMLEMQQMNIFKDGKIPDMFLYFEKDSKFMNDTVEKIKNMGIKF